MDVYKEKITLDLPQYQAVVLHEFLLRINEQESVDKVEQRVLFDLEATLEKLLFSNTGVPEVPFEDIVKEARSLVQADMQ